MIAKEMLYSLSKEVFRMSKLRTPLLEQVGFERLFHQNSGETVSQVAKQSRSRRWLELWHAQLELRLSHNFTTSTPHLPNIAPPPHPQPSPPRPFSSFRTAPAVYTYMVLSSPSELLKPSRLSPGPAFADTCRTRFPVFLFAGPQAQLILWLHPGRGDRELLPLGAELVAEREAHGKAARVDVSHVPYPDSHEGDLHQRFQGTFS